MTGGEVVARLATSGLALRRDGNGIQCRGAQGALTDELRALVSSHRSEVLRSLTLYGCGGCGRFAFARPTVCYWCRGGAPRRIPCGTAS